MASAKKQKTNTALRQWARGISFTIAMGRRQVFTLVSLHLSAEREHGKMMMVGDRHRFMCSFVTSANCLVDRGLVDPHIWKKETLRREANKHKMGELWQLTRAGELVIGLLQEAGIYDEVRAELENTDRLHLRLA